MKPEHLIELRDHLSTLPAPPRLLIVDPVASFASKGNINEARAAEVRAILDPLSELAQETGMAVLVVAHLNKSANHGPASNRVAGSRAYIDSARLAYCVDANPDDPDQRLLMPVKTNIFGVNKQTAPFALQRIDEDAANALRSHPSVSDLDDADFAKLVEHLGTVRFGTDVDVSADDVLGGKSNTSATKAGASAVWLREFLAEFAYPSVEVEKAAAKANFGFDCLKRAKAKLKVDGLRHKKDDGTGGAWWCGWGPPEA